MKKYIFIMPDIHTMGGVQNYVRCKLKYLLQDKWKIYILYTEGGSQQDIYPFQELEPYANGKISGISKIPSIIGTVYQKIIVSEMINLIEYEEERKDYFIIESTGSYEAIWGEILSERIKGKHISFICNENFREPWQWYTKFMDFFEFKYDRQELAGISEYTLKMLFEGYREVDISDRFTLIAAIEDTVQDIYSDKIYRIEKKEWNIAYLGRCEKKYFSTILDDILYLSKKYLKKEIQFIIVGELKQKEKNNLKKLDNQRNLRVNYLGYFSPIPQELFRKIDAVIAGSGCSYISYMQGVPTIVADARNGNAIGICGYTTNSILYDNTEYSYVELLEDILITKKYLKHEKKQIEFIGVQEAYNKFFSFIKLSKQEKEYYDFSHVNFTMNFWEKTVIIQYIFEKFERNKNCRLQFVNEIYQNLGTDIGLFGYGVMGRMIYSKIPELKIKIIYDNNEEIKDTIIPTERELNRVEALIISPLAKKKEILDELKQKNYRGKVGFLDILIENYLRKVYEKETIYNIS